MSTNWSRTRSRTRFWIKTRARRFGHTINKVSFLAIRKQRGRRTRSLHLAGVADIRELCVQFQRAIAALASNDVAELETSTAAQDSLVDKLTELVSRTAIGPAAFRQSLAVRFPGAREPDAGVLLICCTRLCVPPGCGRRCARPTNRISHPSRSRRPPPAGPARSEPMPGLNTSLSIAVQALEANQGALERHHQQHRQRKYAGIQPPGRDSE